ncbi:hypothetical protein TNCV_3606121 [Trichonephila clavipes]|uniref:Uncharacterized protein n=1 Tax=Trichonephila clavipes TaxID=2585209 RepID=A0A8X6RHK8_TRICX|nr:hypothetical protein TNCV_3606121 [Trichonephila clavipes]
MSQFTLGHFSPSRESSLAPNPPDFADYGPPLADRDSARSPISPIRIPRFPSFFRGRDLTRAPSIFSLFAGGASQRLSLADLNPIAARGSQQHPPNRNG